MMFGRAAISALILMTSGTTSWSAVSLVLTNRSGDTISAVTAVPKDAIGVEPTGVLMAPIAPDAESAITIEAADGQCLFDLTISFASGKVSDMPDIDICQADGVIIE